MAYPVILKCWCWIVYCSTVKMWKYLIVQPPINPTPRPYFRVLWIRTLLYPGSRGRWEQLWRVYPDGGCYDTLANGALVYISQGGRWCAKGCMHWGGDSSVVNDPLGEPGHTPLYVGLPSAWVSMDGDHMFFPICRRAHFWGLRQTYMN